jgi:hypothetical protein
MKKISVLLSFFCLVSIAIYPLDEKEAEKKQKLYPLKTESIIKLQILNQNFDKALELISSSYEENSYDYLFFMGYLEENRDNYRDAEKYFGKAFELEGNEEAGKALLRIYIERSSYNKANNIMDLLAEKNPEIENDTSFILLREKLKEGEENSSDMGISLRLSSTDNMYDSASNKEDSLYNTFDFYYTKKKKWDNNYNCTRYLLYLNEIYYDDSDLNTHDFYIGNIIEKDYKVYTIYYPLELDFGFEGDDDNGYRFGAGVGAKRSYSNKYFVDYKTQLRYDSDMKGYVHSNRAGVAFVGPWNIEYDLKVNLDNESYDDDNDSLLTIGYDFNFRKEYSKENIFNFRMKLDIDDYKEGDTKDMVEKYIFAYERVIGSDTNLLFEYKYENIGSNYSSREYKKSTISAGISKIF